MSELYKTKFYPNKGEIIKTIMNKMINTNISYYNIKDTYNIYKFVDKIKDCADENNISKMLKLLFSDTEIDMFITKKIENGFDILDIESVFNSVPYLSVRHKKNFIKYIIFFHINYDTSKINRSKFIFKNNKLFQIIMDY